jgi:hypothetical protein
MNSSMQFMMKKEKRVYWSLCYTSNHSQVGISHQGLKVVLTSTDPTLIKNIPKRDIFLMSMPKNVTTHDTHYISSSFPIASGLPLAYATVFQCCNDTLNCNFENMYSLKAKNSV